MPHDQFTIETDLFEHRIVKPNFINPCCFGEDFAIWLAEKLASLATDGFSISAPIQEDYGWGLWVRRGRTRFWIALSYVGDGPQEEPAQWIVSISRGGFAFLRLFGGNDQHFFAMVRDRVSNALRSDPAILILDDQNPDR